MKIIINGDFLAFSKFGGISRVAFELIKRLDLMFQKGQAEIVCPIYSKNTIKNLKNIAIIKYGNAGIVFWKNFSLKKYVDKERGLLVDITQAFTNVKGITFIHDCIPELFPIDYSRSIQGRLRRKIRLIQRRHIAKISKKIITISNSSKKDIIDILKVPDEKVFVINLGWEHVLEIKADYSFTTNKFILDKPFIFSLGSNIWHKNFKWIISCASQNPGYLFVISGDNSSFTKNQNKFSLPNNLIFTGYLSDEEVKGLMIKCKAFLLPSFYEGFGIPPLEALSLNKPIIISDISCFREIYKNSAHYINPWSTNNVSIEKILSSPVSSAKEVLEKNNWDSAAQKVFSIIRETNGL